MAIEQEAVDNMVSVFGGRALAAALYLSEDSHHIVAGPVVPRMAKWSDVVALLPDNDVCWILTNVYFATMGGGKRHKTVLCSYAPDDLTRKSYREAVQRKMSVALAAADFKHLPCFANASVFMHQCRGPADLDVNTVVEKASKFEMGTVDPTSVEKFANGVAI